MQRTITLAKQHAANGNTEGARRILESAIRAALSAKAANAYRAALAEIG